MVSVTKRGRSAFVLACLLVVAVFFIQGCEKGVPPQLSSEEREVEHRFAAAIQDNLNVFIAAYRWKWPKTVNTDNARELSKDYAPDGFESMTEKTKTHRTKYTLATQTLSRSLAMEVYKQMLKEQPTGTTQSHVVFTAGGAGSGKSTSVTKFTELQQILDQAQIVVDTTLSSEGALEQIKMALDARKIVKIYYVYRDPELAFAGMLERATQTGRPVTLTNFIDTHLGAPKALDGIVNMYSEEIKNGTVTLDVIDNTGDFHDLKFEQQGANFVRNKAEKYDPNQLRKQLHNTLDNTYQKGAISKEIYDAINK